MRSRRPGRARLLPALVAVLLLTGFGRTEPPEPASGKPTTPEEVHRLRLDGAWLEVEPTMSDAELEVLLDLCLAPEGRRHDFARRTVSEALTRRILARRTAALRTRAPSDEALASRPQLDVLAYPRVDGSTSTMPLHRVVCCRLFSCPYRWGVPAEAWADTPFTGPANGAPIGLASTESRPTPLALRVARSAVLADAWDPAHERLASIVNGLLVRHRGTHEAWTALIEGRCDLALVARSPSPEEASLAAARGVGIDTRPVAHDAFVFLASRTNPVRGLTLEQVRRIYRGEITSWSEVGGPAEAIRPLQRDPNSGSQELFLTLVMRGEDPVVPPRDLLAHSMTGPYELLERLTDGLGYTVWYYARYMAVIPEVKVLALDGVFPDPEAIADGRYPLVTEVHAAVRADEPAGSAARRLRDWLLTPEGQAVVAESGYLPLARGGSADGRDAAPGR